MRHGYRKSRDVPRSRAVASLEAGEGVRLETKSIASGARRLSVGLPRRRSRPMARIVASTAAAWPCGSARRMRIPSSVTATPPRSRVRNPSTRVVGQSDRLARVRFLTRPLSRKLSRNRMAGGELRLDTDSIYMAPLLTFYDQKYIRNLLYYMGTRQRQKWRKSCRRAGDSDPQK